MLNHVEKLILHFISANYDADSLPYYDTPAAEVLRVSEGVERV